jgi:ribonucleotide reductase beta subunit family protein with ferritin-like domain
MAVQMKTYKEAYVYDYDVPVEMAKQQNEVFWLADEIKVEKDVQDIMVNMTESERHGVITVLKLFTLYELVIGKEYWGNRVMKTFPRPDIQMMASAFSYFELNVHAPFYNKLNEALHLNTEEFYTSYVDDPVLKERMRFVEKSVISKKDLVSVGAFSLIEGAVLYSAFAFLKHFQSVGKNKLLNVVRGINFSVRDENLHCLGGAWIYNQLKKEMIEAGEEDEQYFKDVEEEIRAVASKIYEHEARIVDMIFEEGPMDGITDIQMKRFIESRINICLKNLEIKPIFESTYNPIADWFYDGINAYQMNDFFTGVGNSYNRNWSEDSFSWGQVE